MDRINHAEMPGCAHPKGLPLSFVMLRYFAYVLIGTLVLAGGVVSALTAAINAGLLYPANYASIHAEETVASLENGAPTDSIPSCYRWAVYNAERFRVEEDLDSRTQAQIERFLHSNSENGAVGSTSLGAVSYCVEAALPDGSTCVLSYDFNPDFTSKRLRDTLPDPQGSILAIGAMAFFGMVIGIARRASKVIGAKLAPLSYAAEHIARQDLEFVIRYGNVRETNEALAAIERMRISLKKSLEAQWASEQAQRNAISSLAHDLKTPLTIVRGNADLLLETPLDKEQSLYSHAMRNAAKDIERFVARIIEASRNAPSSAGCDRCGLQAFVEDIRDAADSLAAAYGAHVEVRADLEKSLTIPYAVEMKRALLNLIDNAFEYGSDDAPVRILFETTRRENSPLRLRISVFNEGTGFSSEALARASERFYRGDASRNPDGHYGLGLSIAKNIMATCDGELTLSNTETGACAMLEFACSEDGSMDL